MSITFKIFKTLPDYYTMIKLLAFHYLRCFEISKLSNLTNEIIVITIMNKNNSNSGKLFYTKTILHLPLKSMNFLNEI